MVDIADIINQKNSSEELGVLFLSQQIYILQNQREEGVLCGNPSNQLRN